MTGQNPFDFTRMFSSLGMPGMVTPTLDVDELDKKIKDLKAVEGWLSMNLSMLQMTIQGLEVQRNTLSSIKAMGEALSQSVQARPADEAAPDATTAAADSPESTPASWAWNLMSQAMQNLAPFPPATEVAEAPTQPVSPEAGKPARKKPAARKSANGNKTGSKAGTAAKPAQGAKAAPRKRTPKAPAA